MYRDSTASRLVHALSERERLEGEYRAACGSVSRLLVDLVDAEGTPRAEVAEFMGVSGPRVTQILQRARREIAAEHAEGEAKDVYARTASRHVGRHSGFRHGAPQCYSCRRIMGGYEQSCECGGYSRPREGARGGRTV